ncbi:MAG: hypothetical protein P1P83_13010 [Bacteroidales bacterium]|nr:hypothetical protein [Bacteroidales bacterium]MDT8372353.1 hypothetical protein [Bacteroidales bacterium]
MPSNLNALIRYKTINSCLFGGKRRWSIDELMERCSEALAENRGKYTSVSERTIRDDLRVMRSDILGFNAPIKQEGGLYFYSDPGYSILSLRITDTGLAEQIFYLLMRIRSRESLPELEIILQRLCGLLGRKYEPVYVKSGKVELSEISTQDSLMSPMEEDAKYDLNVRSAKVHASRNIIAFRSMKQKHELLWGDVLGAI